MKILFSTSSFYPTVGGVEKHVYKVSKELINLGHTVKVLTFNNESNSFVRTEQYEGISILRMPHYKRAIIRYVQNLLWFFRNRSWFDGVNVVHFHDTFFPQMRLILPEARLVETFHGFESFPPKKFFIKARAKVAQSVDRVVIVGDFITKWYGTKSDLVIYGGVDDLVVPDTMPEYDAVFVGRLEQDTGIEDYINIVKMYKDEGVVFKFAIYGGGTKEDYLKGIVAKYGLPVTFLGITTDSRKAVLTAKYVFSSSYLSMLEAMSLKRLVFSVYKDQLKRDYLESIPSSREKFVYESSAEQLYSKMKATTNDQALVSLYVNCAYTWAIGNTWRDVAKSYLNLYE